MYSDFVVPGPTVIHRPAIIKARTRDGFMTFDQAFRTHDSYGNNMGRRVDNRSWTTHDGRTIDSTGAFLVSELERLDQNLHMPLAMVSWQRDVETREDVTIADEQSSYTVSTFGSPGGLGTGTGPTGGKSWTGKRGNQAPNISVDIAKVINPLTLWDEEISYTIPELESAIRVGRPVDQQKFSGLQLKHQMDTDAMVYAGDSDLGRYGLVNSDSRPAGLDRVTNVTNVPNGANGSPLWINKTPGEILRDVNSIISSTWTASAWAVVPERLLLPPNQYSYISTQLISTAGNQSILKYVMENNLLTTSGKGKLDIYPCKWLIGAGVGGTIGTVGIDRMVCYTKNREFVRYPMTLLQRTPIQYQSIYHSTTYFGRLGVLEIVYPETVGYADGI